jgi:hypothetical protein
VAPQPHPTAEIAEREALLAELSVARAQLERARTRRRRARVERRRREEPEPAKEEHGTQREARKGISAEQAPREEEPRELQEVESGFADAHRRTVKALESAVNRLEEVEARVSEAEAHVARAERLAKLRVEETRRQRLYGMLDRIVKLEHRAMETELRAKELNLVRFTNRTFRPSSADGTGPFA